MLISIVAINFKLKTYFGGAKNRQSLKFWFKIDKTVYIFIIGINNDIFILFYFIDSEVS